MRVKISPCRRCLSVFLSHMDDKTLETTGCATASGNTYSFVGVRSSVRPLCPSPRAPLITRAMRKSGNFRARWAQSGANATAAAAAVASGSLREGGRDDASHRKENEGRK